MIEIDTIHNGDSKDVLKDIDDDSIDLIVTDPPYGYSFMGKDWDKAVIGIDIWSECLRVLKAGAFAFIMSSPRQDVLSRMIVNLEDAGFVVGFTSIYWTYASGFPKASNISKMVDKRMGAEREVVGLAKDISHIERKDTNIDDQYRHGDGNPFEHKGEQNLKTITIASTLEAKALDGSYGGFQPKPAVEVVLVVMKPLAEKTFVDQALANGHGVTWLDDGRIPYDNNQEDDSGQNYYRRRDMAMPENKFSVYGNDGGTIKTIPTPQGRFPANLLVSDDVLNDGVDRIPKWGISKAESGSSFFGNNGFGGRQERCNEFIGDIGSFSRYFSLDAWWDNRIEQLPESVQKTLPFIICPKPSKAEKNKGLDGGTGSNTYNRKCLKCGKWERNQGIDKDKYTCYCESPEWEQPQGNVHPTVKSIKLFSYLITLGSREGDLILDPFVGSGTSCVSAKILNRHWIGIERESEYVTIAERRIDAEKSQMEFSLAGG